MRRRRVGAPLARLKTAAAFALAAALLAGCADRPYGDLIAVGAVDAPGASRVDMLVATTRAAVNEPAGVMFGGERGRGLAYADIEVSVPADAARKVGEVQWPSSPPGDPAHDFVTLRADRLDEKQVKAAFDARVSRAPGKQALIFVHGYNTRFEEAVYRFAQIAHDSHAEATPLLFTWPSRGRLFDYVYDRDSATYSRDALEGVLQTLDKDPNVGSIAILAHSMGNFVAVEALRQMTIRNHGGSTKIHDVMLASPDIDLDVFRRQIAEIEGAKNAPHFTLFVSQDDRALGLSSFIAGDAPRVGAVDPLKEPYRSLLAKAKVSVVDLTDVASDDSANHAKFATGGVVAAIGARLAAGQTLTDARAGFGESIGKVAIGAANAVGSGAALVLTAPQQLADRSRAERPLDPAAAPSP